MFKSLEHRAAGTMILNVDTCASTNELALRQGIEGTPAPFWVAAGTQTAGKGRDGRQWVSVAGNLHATLLLLFPGQIRASTQLAALAGVAVADAIEAAAQATPPPTGWKAGKPHPPAIQLKWPNDVLLGTPPAPGQPAVAGHPPAGKVAGVLIETTTRPRDGAFIVAIGIGINLREHPHGIDQPTASLAAHGIDISPDEMLAQLDRSMLGWLERWQDGTRFADIRTRWHERSCALGTRVNVRNAGVPMHGICQGLDDDGALLLIDAVGRSHRITYGDVTIQQPNSVPVAVPGDEGNEPA